MRKAVVIGNSPRVEGLPGVVAAIAAVSRGEVIVVVDDEGGENEGDLIAAAEFATPEMMAFFVRHTSGLIGAAMTDQRADELRLPLMVERNTEARRTAFTVTVDAVAGTSTGISAVDRSHTIRTLVAPGTKAADLARPGHVHVVRSRKGGVLSRAGHTEAAVDLARLAGLSPAGVLCGIVGANGVDMARGPELQCFAAAHGLHIITVADLIRHRMLTETLVLCTAETRVTTEWGEFRALYYTNELDGTGHVAFVLGDTRGAQELLVRVHSECLTGNVFRSLRCDCGAQLAQAMARVAAEGAGVVVYLRGQEGRGIGLTRKLQAYGLQDGGLDTVDANLELGLPVDNRQYWAGAQILAHLGIESIRLMTNNPSKWKGMEGFGVRIASREPIQTVPTAENIAYLETKRRRMGHLLDDVDASNQSRREL